MKRFINWKIFAIILVALVLGFYDLPAQTQENILPFTPDSFKNKIHLGLDLQGGSQLDYKIDLRKVPENEQQDIIDGVLEVIQKRVNALGVAEPNIYTSDIAGETHIIVELAETADISQEDIDTYLKEEKTPEELTDDEKKFVSLEKAKATVGKTIQLEFKEEKGSLDPQEKDKIRENASNALNRIKEGADYSVVGQEEEQAYPGKVEYEKSGYVFKDEIPSGIQDSVIALEPGSYTQELVETGGTFIVNSAGEMIMESGLAIVKLDDKKEELRHEKAVNTSHILVSFTGAEGADATVTRNEDEAFELAKELVTKLEGGDDFAELAKEYSDDKSNSEEGGILESPVSGDGTYVTEFESAALGLKNEGDISEISKTKFGYHIIKAGEIKTNVKETQYKYETITYSLLPDEWKETGLTGEHFVHADVQLDQYYQPYVTIQFDDEGGKLFEEITERNIGKQLAIFVGGELISAPNVNEKIAGGSAQITGQFTTEEAKTLARDLNTGAIPAPIVLTGEYTIGATLGQQALSDSLFAGLIGLILVMVFMLLYYRLAGLIADIALSVYAVILLFLIKSQMPLSVAILLSLIVFVFLVFKIVNNQDSGWEKFLSFILSCFAFFFLTFLLKTGVVMTLAGIAGIILSIGMAVDANILIFERFKEEIRDGKSYSAAVDSAFDRAWTAIRDSNFSTLLTCAILFYFGSSIIRGFAFNLAAGILVSMFTAIVITRTLLKGFVGKNISKNLRAFGVNPNKKAGKGIDFIRSSKTWLSASGVLIIIAIIAMFSFGLNLGIDFKGGTLMEFSFKENISKETLTSTLKEIEKEINSAELPSGAENSEEGSAASISVTDTKTSEEGEFLSQDESTELDLSNITILQSEGNNFIVKTKYLTSSFHDRVLAKMQEKLPNFTESRFTTIGPVIGSTMLQKAIIAIFVALIFIILYIGFAFRKVPKEVNPWRFGACAIIALIHDVIIITGVFIILGAYLGVEIDALFITAMLTVFGYSVNDTIVIFDRLRENLLHAEKDDNITTITNKSLNQTFARSINTSFSTLLTLLAILFWGSPSIFYFVLALTLGTVVGTYSSLFIASPILVKWKKAADKMKP